MKKVPPASHYLDIQFPCKPRKFSELSKIIKGLRAVTGEWLCVDLINSPSQLSFVQCFKTKSSYSVDVGFMDPGSAMRDKAQRASGLTLEQAIDIFKEVVTKGVVSPHFAWKDVTNEVYCMSVSIKVFRQAYKTVRENSDHIYRAFGLRHLADATQYYLHPNNQSARGKTSLAQPIGESIILLSLLSRSIAGGKALGDIFYLKEGGRYFLEIDVPQDYRDNKVVNQNIYHYKAYKAGNSIKIAAYNQEKSLITGDITDLVQSYKLLPVFLVLLYAEINENPDFRILYEKYLSAPEVDAFVNLHEDFYQNHKDDEYQVAYHEIADIDHAGWDSYAAAYRVFCENQANRNSDGSVFVPCFNPGDFGSDARFFIPRLPSEFVLPAELAPLCNAIVGADVIATLLHGPAGTGKTMSCKLICQRIGLPILETVNCTENLDEFVLGKFIPEEDRIVFKESLVTRAIREGGAVVFEEINFAKPQYLAFLNSLLDDNGFVRLDNGEIVERHRNFRFFATMNIGYFGTKELNQSLYNRFNATIEIAELSRTAIERMLVARIPECQPMVGKIIGVYEKVKNKIESEELDYVISPRNLENWARLAKYEGYVKAAEKTIIPIAKCDRSLESTIRGIMMLYKWKA